MVKKLKGKATYEPKGEELRKRERKIQEAFDFWKKLLPFIIVMLIIILVAFGYWMNQKQVEKLKATTK